MRDGIRLRSEPGRGRGRPATYVDQCQTALMLRRLWAIPLVVVGSIVLVVVAGVATIVWGRESVFGEDPVA